MSQTADMPNYTIELSDGLIRPMTVKELVVRLEQLMSADKRIAEMYLCPPSFRSEGARGRQSGGRCGRRHCRRGLRLLWCSQMRSDRVGQIGRSVQGTSM